MAKQTTQPPRTTRPPITTPPPTPVPAAPSKLFSVLQNGVMVAIINADSMQFDLTGNEPVAIFKKGNLECIIEDNEHDCTPYVDWRPVGDHDKKKRRARVVQARKDQVERDKKRRDKDEKDRVDKEKKDKEEKDKNKGKNAKTK